MGGLSSKNYLWIHNKNCISLPFIIIKMLVFNFVNKIVYLEEPMVETPRYARPSGGPPEFFLKFTSSGIRCILKGREREYKKVGDQML